MVKRYFSAAMALCVGLTLFPTSALAADEGEAGATPELYSDVADIIGPSKPPNVEPEEVGGGDVTLPDPNSLQSNEDFKPYDPAYPKREQYGDYTFQVPDLKGRLTFSNSNNKVVGTLFAPGTSRNTGWKDATKKWGHYDFGLCFAASSSNLISWYLDLHKKLHPEDTTAYVTNVEQIFDTYRNGWDSAVGGDQKEALSWYFTGGFPRGGDQPGNNHLNGKEPGGYLRWKIPNNNSDRWSDVSSFQWDPKEVYTAFGSHDDNQFPFMEEVSGNYDYGANQAPLSTHKRFSDQILRQLHYGACTISITKDSSTGGSGHAITLWGADYDVKTGLVTAIHVTDSDDGGRGMLTVGIEKSQGEVNGTNDGIRMVKYPYIGQGDNAQPYTKIRDSIVMYAPGVVKANQNYTGSDAVIDTLTPDSDGRGVDVQVSNISGYLLEYGYSYDQDANNVVGWQSDSHFSGLEPDQYYFFARVKETSEHKAGGVSASAAYRVTTPSPVSQESVPAFSFGTTAFHPYKGARQYVWYGTERGSDERGWEEPILWQVLDTKTNREEPGLFLLSDKLYGSGHDGDVNFSRGSNHYQGSDAQQWCREFESKHIAPHEQAAIFWQQPRQITKYL